MSDAIRVPSGEPERLRWPIISETAETPIGSTTAPTVCKRPRGASVLR